MKLVLCDLDNTLLSGDSDVLWCDFLIDRGVLDRALFAARNADIDARYQDGTVGLDEFANFYLSTLAGQTPAHWEALRQEFLSAIVIPRIGPGARDLVNRHLAAGDLVVMTTATNRFITELTAAYLHIDHLIATEPHLQDGRFTGGSTGVLNMREGKVLRLHDWLAGRDLLLQNLQSVAYSDSINDLPLLKAADRAVAVDPDNLLRTEAVARGWEILCLER